MTLEEDLERELQETAAEVGFAQEPRRPTGNPNVSQQQHLPQQHHQGPQHQQYLHQHQPSYHHHQQPQQPLWHASQPLTGSSSAAGAPPASSPRNGLPHLSHHSHNNLPPTTSQLQHQHQQQQQQQQSFPSLLEQDGLLVNTTADISAAQAQNFVHSSRYRLEQTLLAPPCRPGL
ncbi:MAG: hypothetical protein WDW38_001813 [Sanguina aurantia]